MSFDRLDNKDNDTTLVLTNEDRTKGFSARTDGHGVTLLRWGRPVAWFSRAVTTEVIRAFLEVLKHYETDELRISLGS